MIEMTVDVPARRINARFAGFFDLAEAREFVERKQRILQDQRWKSREYDLVVDCRACAIQPQDVATAFQSIVRSSPQVARSLAVVVTGALARIQAKRIADRDDVGVFDDMAAAERWLDRSEAIVR